ncbi:MAG: glycoside hydrolase family 88 protein [Prevotella sp.]|nr:glycoside hydrolase family 88 protein [Prevotella sp.]
MKFKTLIIALLFPTMLMASVWETEYKQIESSITEPQFANREFLITKYGASLKVNDAAKNQKAINKAIEACSKAGGGRVIVPEGTWNTGAITLKSNVNLVIEKGATLLFAFDRSLYPNVPTRWEGLDCWNYQPLIYAYQQQNIGITGEGTIDGNGSDDTWWLMSGKTPKSRDIAVPEKQQNPGGRADLLKYAEDGVDMDERVFGAGKGLRPQLVNLNQCENILIEGVTMLRSPFWVMHPLLSKNITVRNVKVWNEGPNGDGCDPESCENVLIENCVFHTGDDCIAIKSGRNADGRAGATGRYAGIPSKNFIIRNCVMEDGHGGVVIGSEISGGCQNVFVENCQMDSPSLDRVLRIKTNSCRGGVIENIYFRNVTVGQCGEAVLKINTDYEPKEVCCRGFYPIVRNVYMEKVTCKKSKYGVMIVGYDDEKLAYTVNNIHVKDCTFDGVYNKPIHQTGKAQNLYFENLMINGSLVLSEKPYKTYSQWMTHSEMQRVPHSYMLDFAKTNPRWSYTSGTEMGAMLDTYKQYNDVSIYEYLKEYPAKMIDEKGGANGYKYEDFNLDNVRPGKFLIAMYKKDPQPNHLLMLKTLYKQLEKQPRTKEGVFWHKAIYANQVWLDGIFMGLPYYTEATPLLKKAKKAKKYYNDIVDQVVKTDKRTFDAKTGLWKHAWDETHTAFWADKETGQSKHTWARAMGWYVMAMVEVLDELPQDFERRGEVIDVFQRAMAALVKHQDKKTGVWYDVLDVKDPRNYLESTASSMFTYCLLKGARKGYLGEKFREAGIKGYKGIIEQFIRVNADKTISLTRCCEVSGLGPAPGPYVTKPNYKRDGSFDYYMSEPIRDNDGKGVGPFIWASLEMEQLGYDVNSFNK